MGEVFNFKKFEVCHSNSSMKVGVDAVLIGSWTNCKGSKIVDVGTGCGVIALMMAQRFPKAVIDAIDIDIESVLEAMENFNKSAYRERLNSHTLSFKEFCETASHPYDLIISNPPFFRSGINEPNTAREKARHQGELSPFSLLEQGKNILSDYGRIAMIIPTEFYEEVKLSTEKNDMRLLRVCHVRNRADLRPKRIMLEIGRHYSKNFNSETFNDEPIPHLFDSNLKDSHPSLIEEELIMFEMDGLPTLKYRALCQDFYLKF